MTEKSKKQSPHCPVAGCQTKKAHADNPIVKALILEFSPPEKMTGWVLAAMVQLRESICRDLEAKNLFAWHSRLRQPEELYIRTLYALFVATDKELPHILSGDMPNGLSRLYAEVNRVVFGSTGLLQAVQPGLDPQTTFKAVDMLNDGAHVSFRGFLTCIGLERNPQNITSPERYRKHLTIYCDNLNYMHGMFKAGREKKHVLDGLISLHRPAMPLRGKS